MSLTTDRNNPNLKETREDGQQKSYLVLSDEELAQGFVRPVRTTYVHVGKKVHGLDLRRMLDEEERKEHPKYVAILTSLLDENGEYLGGAYVTQEELDAWREGRRIGGCGTSTTMGQKLAETYARQPSFYGATYCVHCGGHYPVSEFVWQGTNETVGS